MVTVTMAAASFSPLAFGLGAVVMLVVISFFHSDVATRALCFFTSVLLLMPHIKEGYKLVSSIYKGSINKVNSLRTPRELDTLSTSPQPCREVLAKEVLDTRGFKIENQYTFLESRAYANRQLIHVFGINNSFTSTDEDLHVQFRKRALLFTRGDAATFRKLSRRAQEHVICTFVDTGEEFFVELMPLVQNLTLRMAIIFLFDVDPPSDSSDALAAVAREINRLWQVAKKERNLNESNLFQNNSYLGSNLQKLLPNAKLHDPTQNPLNYIIPAYESIWRVALCGFVECQRAMAQGEHPWDYHQCFSRFLSDLEKGVVNGEEKTSQQVTALHIAQESLRLYPSTRRVYRSFKANRPLRLLPSESLQCASQEFEVAADVELCQRSTWAAGNRFNPDRWTIPEDDDAQDNPPDPDDGFYEPFGTPEHKCPASRKFGYKLVALLISALTVPRERPSNANAHGSTSDKDGTSNFVGEGSISNDGAHTHNGTALENGGGWSSKSSGDNSWSTENDYFQANGNPQADHQRMKTPLHRFWHFTSGIQGSSPEEGNLLHGNQPLRSRREEVETWRLIRKGTPCAKYLNLE